MRLKLQKKFLRSTSDGCVMVDLTSGMLSAILQAARAEENLAAAKTAAIEVFGRDNNAKDNFFREHGYPVSDLWNPKSKHYLLENMVAEFIATSMPLQKARHELWIEAAISAHTASGESLFAVPEFMKSKKS